ncbi:MAG TPA: hypothetical protein VMG31_12910 [Verrucomicrobiae bacterium]|nr:hypothetical protein [Verrucomicrobiae bacterium]
MGRTPGANGDAHVPGCQDEFVGWKRAQERMRSGDLSTELSLGIVAPGSSVRPERQPVPDRGGDGKARRRPRPPSEADEGEAPGAPGDDPTHQVDDLA